MNRKTESALRVTFDAVGGDLRDMLKEVKEHWGLVSTKKFTASAFTTFLQDETGKSVAELGELSPSECVTLWREIINRKPTGELEGVDREIINAMPLGVTMKAKEIASAAKLSLSTVKQRLRPANPLRRLAYVAKTLGKQGYSRKKEL